MRNRVLLPILAALALVLGAGVWAIIANSGSGTSTTSGAKVITPSSAQVARAEEQRTVAGAEVRDVTLTAAPTEVDLGGRTVSTWAFNGKVPGPTIRANAGDVVKATVVNNLPDPLTVHWHGLALRNDMDGVPDLTQKAIEPGDSFAYEFTAPDPGTYFYHPHTGTQLDRGLYGALVVDDPAQTRPAKDIPILLDDWIDGTGKSPDDVFDDLKANAMDMRSSSDNSDMGGMDMGEMGMGEMDMGDSSTDSPLGSDISDVKYPLYLINGKDAADPATYSVRAGDTIRLRLVNAASATPFRVAFGGGQMTVVATDGYAVEPVKTDALLIGMGERYDVEVTVPDDGAFPLVAVPEGQTTQALAVLRAGTAKLPMADIRPSRLDGHLLTLAELSATAENALPDGTPDETYQVKLTGNMMAFDWGVSASEADGVTLPVKAGDRVRLVIDNTTSMWHPIHLHGHTFQVVTDDGTGPRKDTVIVTPKSKVTVDVIADNPGQWALHCHNIYHAEAGMVTILNYLA